MKQKIRAYSYIRFSTPEQAKGDSLRRQLQDTRDYCAKEGITLDETLRDEGVSAFRGANKAVGALSLFLAAVERGDVPTGSVLILESLDRLSREAAFEAQFQLLSLIRKGIKIVTLADHTTYSKSEVEKNPALLVYATMVAMRAHDESANKQRRLAAKWKDKREKIAAGTHVRMHLPAWLRWDAQKNKIVLHTERAALVKQIFEWRAAGWSRRRIVKWLNSEGVKPWGPRKRKASGWHDSYINKLLQSRSVFGEHQPYILTAGRNSPREKVGEPIKKYFPAAITEKLFHSVHADTSAARPIKGRPSNRNLFTSLVFDRHGSPLHYQDKGDGLAYLTTSLAHQTPKAEVTRWRYDHFEAHFLAFALNLNWRAVLTDEDNEIKTKVIELKGQLREVQEKIDALQREIDRATALALSGDLGVIGESLRTRAAQLTADMSALTTERTRLQNELAEATKAQDLAKTSQREIVQNLSGSLENPATRERVRQEIKRLVAKIELFDDGKVPREKNEVVVKEAIARLTGNRGLKARATGKVVGAFRITFANGKVRTVWVPYRSSSRVIEEPIVLQISGDGYSESEWADEINRVGHAWIDMDEAERLMPPKKRRKATLPEEASTVPAKT